MTLSDEDKKGMTEEQIEEHEYKRSKLKRRTLGNITFIGELYKLSMLTDKIMHEWYSVFVSFVLFCSRTLLHSKKHSVKKLLISKDERDLECLCGLLKAAGKKMDTPAAEKLFATYFDKIREMSKNEQLFSPRIRFMLLVHSSIPWHTNSAHLVLLLKPLLVFVLLLGPD